MPFSGFRADAIAFLNELSTHNDTAWFESHRADYERALIEPARAFVEDLAPRLKSIDSKIQAIPRVNGSIKPLERRMRFPKGQAPFKDYLDLWFWVGRRQAWQNSGFFLRLSAARLVLAAGMVSLEKEMLARYREGVLDDVRGARLTEVVATLRERGYVVGGESYKKTPRGVPNDHPRAELMKYGGLFATLEGDHPAELGSAALVDYAHRHFAAMAPLHEWLVALPR